MLFFKEDFWLDKFSEKVLVFTIHYREPGSFSLGTWGDLSWGDFACASCLSYLSNNVCVNFKASKFYHVLSMCPLGYLNDGLLLRHGLHCVRVSLPGLPQPGLEVLSLLPQDLGGLHCVLPALLGGQLVAAQKENGVIGGGAVAVQLGDLGGKKIRAQLTSTTLRVKCKSCNGVRKR